jgi:hypothetical protein
MSRWMIGLMIAGGLMNTVTAQPLKAANICRVFKKHPGWYASAKQTEAKWGIPVPVQMAIMKQESHFDSDAKNPNSSAYGYAQALKGTWHVYQKDVDSGSKRDNFKDASNFIGWYASKMKKEAGVSPKSAYQVYLAYYNGIGEYKHDKRTDHFKNAGLAHNVERTAEKYRSQLQTNCGTTLWGQVISFGGDSSAT